MECVVKGRGEKLGGWCSPAQRGFLVLLWLSPALRVVQAEGEVVRHQPDDGGKHHHASHTQATERGEGEVAHGAGIAVEKGGCGKSSCAVVGSCDISPEVCDDSFVRVFLLKANNKGFDQGEQTEQ